MKTVSTKVDRVLFDKLLNVCNTSGCSVSEKLRELIQNHTDHNIQTKTQEKIPVLHFHWEGGRLVQDETTYRNKETYTAKITKIIPNEVRFIDKN